MCSVRRDYCVVFGRHDLSQHPSCAHTKKRTAAAAVYRASDADRNRLCVLCGGVAGRLRNNAARTRLGKPVACVPCWPVVVVVAATSRRLPSIDCARPRRSRVFTVVSCLPTTHTPMRPMLLFSLSQCVRVYNQFSFCMANRDDLFFGTHALRKLQTLLALELETR